MAITIDLEKAYGRRAPEMALLARNVIGHGRYYELHKFGLIQCAMEWG